MALSTSLRSSQFTLLREVKRFSTGPTQADVTIEIFFDNEKGSTGTSVELSTSTERHSKRLISEWRMAVEDLIS